MLFKILIYKILLPVENLPDAGYGPAFCTYNNPTTDIYTLTDIVLAFL